MELSFVYHHEKSGAVSVAHFTWEDCTLYPLASSTAVHWWELLPTAGDITTNDQLGFIAEVISARCPRRRVASVVVKHPSVILSTYEQRLESSSVDCSRFEGFPKLTEKIRRAILDDVQVLAFLAGIHVYQRSPHRNTPVVSMDRTWELEQLWADIT